MLLLTIILIGCGNGNGKLYSVRNLEIFYTDDIQFKYVVELGNFFEQNNLIHLNKKHSVKLTSNSNSFVLKMILNDSLKSLPNNKLKELSYLEDAIAQNVFKNRNFAIEITDAYFNPIIKQ